MAPASKTSVVSKPVPSSDKDQVKVSILPEAKVPSVGDHPGLDQAIKSKQSQLLSLKIRLAENKLSRQIQSSESKILNLMQLQKFYKHQDQNVRLTAYKQTIGQQCGIMFDSCDRAFYHPEGDSYNVGQTLEKANQAILDFAPVYLKQGEGHLAAPLCADGDLRKFFDFVSDFDYFDPAPEAVELRPLSQSPPVERIENSPRIPGSKVEVKVCKRTSTRQQKPKFPKDPLAAIKPYERLLTAPKHI